MEDQPKHTPGPWSWDGTFPITIFDADGYHVISPGGIFPSGATNARLIAAAPDLLACLKDIDWDETGTPTAWPNRERVDAAIAKAEGR
jgi:hypothetical protein